MYYIAAFRPFRKFQLLERTRKQAKAVQRGYGERAPAGLTTQMGLYQRTGKPLRMVSLFLFILALWEAIVTMIIHFEQKKEILGFYRIKFHQRELRWNNAGFGS